MNNTEFIQNVMKKAQEEFNIKFKGVNMNEEKTLYEYGLIYRKIKEELKNE